MIIELIIGAGVVAAGSAIAGIVRARRKARLAREVSDAARARDQNVKAASAARDRGLCVDDVLLYADEELWLAGVLELEEEGFVARLFRTPGAKRGDWVVQLDRQATQVAILRDSTEVPAGSVPERLRIDGMLLSLVKRGRASVKADGAQLPATGDSARYAILGAPGGRTLIVLDFDKAPRIAASGEQLPREMLELLPGGDLRKSET